MFQALRQAYASVASVASYPVVTLRAYRVGGIRFLRIGRLQISFVVCKDVESSPARQRRVTRSERAFDKGYKYGYRFGRHVADCVAK